MEYEQISFQVNLFMAHQCTYRLVIKEGRYNLQTNRQDSSPWAIVVDDNLYLCNYKLLQANNDFGLNTILKIVFIFLLSVTTK